MSLRAYTHTPNAPLPILNGGATPFTFDQVKEPWKLKGSNPQFQPRNIRILTNDADRYYFSYEYEVYEEAPGLIEYVFLRKSPTHPDRWHEQRMTFALDAVPSSIDTIQSEAAAIIESILD